MTMLYQPQAIDPVDSVEVPRTVAKKTLKPAFDATETLLSELQSIPIIDNAEVVNITVNQYEQKIQNTFNSPSGQQFEVQFKNNSQFDGDEGLTYNVDNKILTSQNICVTGTSDLNDVSCLRIRSGSPGEILTKLDYYGNVAWCNPSGFIANTLCVGTINSSNVYTNVGSNITSLAFNDKSNFSIADLGSGAAKISVSTNIEAIENISGATGVVAHNWNLASVFNHTSIASNFTVNITNFNLPTNTGTNIVLILNQGATPYLSTGLEINGVPQIINWQGSTVPTTTANKKDVVSFSITYIGSSYLVLGQLVNFG